MAGLLDQLQILPRRAQYFAQPLDADGNPVQVDSGLLSEGMQFGQAPVPSARRAAPQAPVEGSAGDVPARASMLVPPMSMLPPEPQKTSKLGDILDSMTGGHFAARRERIADEEATRRAALQQQQAKEQLYTMAEALGLREPGREGEFVTFVMNPEEWTKQNAERYGVTNVSGGETALFGDPTRGGSVYTAPKLVEDAGVYGTQTPTGYTQTGQRSLTEKEIADMEAEEERQRIARGQLSVAQSNAARGWAAHEARVKGVGGYNTPGIVVGGWEEF